MSHNPYCPHLLQNRTPSLLPKLLNIIFSFDRMEGTHSKTKNISFSDRSKMTGTNSTTESSAYMDFVWGQWYVSFNWDWHRIFWAEAKGDAPHSGSVAQQYVDRTSDTPHSSAGRHPYLLTWFTSGGTWHQLLLVAHWFRCMHTCTFKGTEFTQTNIARIVNALQCHSLLLVHPILYYSDFWDLGDY